MKVVFLHFLSHSKNSTNKRCTNIECGVLGCQLGIFLELLLCRYSFPLSGRTGQNGMPNLQLGLGISSGVDNILGNGYRKVEAKHKCSRR